MSLLYILHFLAAGFILYDVCYSIYTHGKVTLVDIVESVLAFIPVLNMVIIIGLIILKTCEKNYD